MPPIWVDAASPVVRWIGTWALSDITVGSGKVCVVSQELPTTLHQAIGTKLPFLTHRPITRGNGGAYRETAAIDCLASECITGALPLLCHCRSVAKPRVDWSPCAEGRNDIEAWTYGRCQLDICAICFT